MRDFGPLFQSDPSEPKRSQTLQLSTDTCHLSALLPSAKGSAEVTDEEKDVPQSQKEYKCTVDMWHSDATVRVEKKFLAKAVTG